MSEHLRTVFDETFRFKVGDVVVEKTVAKEAERELNKEQKSLYGERRRGPIGVTVVARFAEECSGGVQRFYRCQGYTAQKDGGAILSTFAEIALEPYEAVMDIARAMKADAKHDGS
jgi:hypothetical protein